MTRFARDAAFGLSLVPLLLLATVFVVPAQILGLSVAFGLLGYAVLDSVAALR